MKQSETKIIVIEEVNIRKGYVLFRVDGGVMSTSLRVIPDARVGNVYEAEFVYDERAFGFGRIAKATLIQ